MAYDGKVMRLALQRFEEDRQRRQAQYQERRERIFARQPRLREIDGELRSTMSRIITSALRHGTDPRSAVAVLRDENLSLQAEKRELLQKMGLPEDALEETPACALCGDTGYRNGRVCRCLRGYYAREQQKELSRMLDLGHQSFDTFSTDWYPDRYDPNIGITVRQHMEMIYDICADLPTSSASARRTSCSSAHPDWERPTSPPPLPGRSARRGIRWFMTPRATSLHNSSSRSSPGKRRPTTTWSGC